MKTNISLLLLFISMVFSACSSAQDIKEPWTNKQLMQPATLAKILNDSSAQITLIYSIGPAGLIKNSIDIGEGKNKQNIEKFRKELSKLAKDADVAIYCGCCPFKDCPNIRPAFNLLNEMKFTNHKLLNLSKNLKVNWIDKDYPMSE
ncbi:MAG: hypothetical protein COA57_12750 [Flavobacteriales bacterium]|nr:hypothetical protein [Bacteroidales bacterium AH-315-I05]PCJ82864.1 MAG: hypothetical protein COA57_12750 [Flavobacteriales bacterium]